MTHSSNDSKVEEILEELRQDALSIAEHYDDTTYQHANYRTMHGRSNMNGVFGEAEKKIKSAINQAVIAELEAAI